MIDKSLRYGKTESITLPGGPDPKKSPKGNRRRLPFYKCFFLGFLTPIIMMEFLEVFIVSLEGTRYHLSHSDFVTRFTVVWLMVIMTINMMISGRITIAKLALKPVFFRMGNIPENHKTFIEATTNAGVIFGIPIAVFGPFGWILGAIFIYFLFILNSIKLDNE